MIAILDYGMGNLKSVFNALEYIGQDCKIINQENEIADCSHLIVPGVGTFNCAMENLNKSNLIPAILQHVKMGKPYLGICLGMQLLATKGYENEITDGLNIIPGLVKKFELDAKFNIPHVGWNEINKHKDHPVFNNIKQNIDFYFVHSYYYLPDDSNNILCSTDYGNNFTSVVADKNVIGVQFHPEKSQENGLKILENFCLWDGVYA